MTDAEKIAELTAERAEVRAAMKRIAEAGQSYSSPADGGRDYGNYDGFRRRLKEIDQELALLDGSGYGAQQFVFGGR